MRHIESIERLIKAFAGLPGIGEKTAARLAVFILNAKKEYAEELAGAIAGVKEAVRLCRVCAGFSNSDVCPLCADGSRDASTVCVVGDYRDMVAIEASGSYRGAYHILHGLIVPLRGRGPEEIKIKELVERAKTNGIREVILGMPFNAEGETTALYIKKVLEPFGIRLTRIATGVPAGSLIEYMDPRTLGRALEGRKEA
jgi:recombination protein RecR